jgi:hypothetical protein
MKFLVRAKGRVKAAHIWFQGDTLCRMASTGGLVLSGYREHTTALGLPVCQMCVNHIVNRAFPKCASKRQARKGP